MATRKLYKSKPGNKLSGVCTGLAIYTGFDVTLIRLIFLALAIFGGGSGVVLYIVCAVVMPDEPDYIDYTYYDKDKDNKNQN